MKTTTESREHTSLAARVAGEDLRRGDFITLLNETVELPSFLWSGSEMTLPADELIRISYKACDAGQPYKVHEICLPFIYAKRVRGGMKVIDTRRQQVVRLDPQCGLSVWEEMRKSFKKKRK